MREAPGVTPCEARPAIRFSKVEYTLSAPSQLYPWKPMWVEPRPAAVLAKSLSISVSQSSSGFAETNEMDFTPILEAPSTPVLSARSSTTSSKADWTFVELIHPYGTRLTALAAAEVFRNVSA